MRRFRKIVVFGLIGIAALALVSAAGLFIVLQTDWFKNKVRERIVSVAETATGGRVEIGGFDYDWRSLTAEVGPFVLHGTEPPAGPPLFRADKIQVGLKIISAFKKQVDILSLLVDKPQVYVVVAPDGSTNVPSLKVAGKKNVADQLLDLKIKHFELRDGVAEYNSAKIPIDVRGDRLQASLVYEAGGPRYAAEISAKPIRVVSSRLRGPASFDLAAKLALERNAIQVIETNVGGEGWKAQLKGSVNDLASPRASFDVTASAAVKDLKKTFALPLESRGDVSFQGKGSLESSPFQYKIDGRVSAKDLGYAYQDVAVRNIGVSSRAEITPSKISLPDLELSALSGHFRGSVQIVDYKQLTVQGTAQGFALKEIATLGGRDSGDLSGTLSGPVRLDAMIGKAGLANITADAKMDIAPGIGGVPVRGNVSVNYDQRAGLIQLGDSEIELGSTRIGVSGTLGQRVIVHATSKNLKDVLPLFPLAGETPPEQLPVALHDGVATLDASVNGPLDDPQVSGKADVTHLALDRREFDHVTATFDMNKSAASFRTMTVAQGKLRVEGQGRVSLRDWKVEDNSSISALLSVRDGDIHDLAEQAGFRTPVQGTIAASMQVSGSVDSPVVNANVQGQNISAYDEHFDSARGDLTYTPTALELTNGQIRVGPGLITVTGAYNHPANDWKDGSLRFDVASSRLTLASDQACRRFPPRFRRRLGDQKQRRRESGERRAGFDFVERKPGAPQCRAGRQALREFGTDREHALAGSDRRRNSRFRRDTASRERRMAHGRRLSRAGAHSDSTRSVRDTA